MNFTLLLKGRSHLRLTSGTVLSYMYEKSRGSSHVNTTTSDTLHSRLLLNVRTQSSVRMKFDLISCSHLKTEI